MTKTAVSIAVLYMIFAAFSTAINIGCQMLSIWVYKGSHAVELSILIGTITGLPVRYFLEKRHIFTFKSRNVAHEGQLFMLYSSMGVFTTVIFWGVEYAFHLLFRTETMRYIGGIIGLAIGFYVKYNLDKRYVFVSREKCVAK